jgi:uncharacterized protein (DUF1697 family)
MPVLVSLLRGVNVGGHRKVTMEDLRSIYESLGLTNVQTYINSGNVLFRTSVRDGKRLRKRIEDAIEIAHGFRSDVFLRTPDELRSVIARNPFAARPELDARKLTIHFLPEELSAEVRQRVLEIPAEPEELHHQGRELYIYFPNGMGRPKLSMALVEKTMKAAGTSRNWNTVRKLLELAEKLERQL